MITYFVGTVLTFGILLKAFLKDRSTSKTDILSWLLVLLGALLWFVTLPFIIRKKLRDGRAPSCELSEFSSQTLKA